MSLSHPNPNLPLLLTWFIGRDAELVEVRHKLEGERLVTLRGPGGVGKTRLALEVAVTDAEVYPDGVWLVELASLSESPAGPASGGDAARGACRCAAQPGAQPAELPPSKAVTAGPG